MLSQNLATMLVAAKVLHQALSTSGEDLADEIVYRQTLPGMGVALCFGCIYYTLQAQLLACSEQRTDLCAQPFGISTPGIFVIVSGVVAPVFTRSGGDALQTWRIACLVNLMQGVVEIICSLIGPYAVQLISTGALLTALASVSFAYLLAQPLQGLAAAPLVALLPLVLVLLALLANVRVPKMPGALTPVLVATVLGWGTGHLKAAMMPGALRILGLHLPSVQPEIFEDFSSATMYAGIILPLALANSLGTLQCWQLAETAGDIYNLRATMLGDGIATSLAALFGCPFGFTVYIGHSALKQMGCRVGYGLAMGFIILAVCCSGTAAVILSIVPVEGLSSFIIFVGLVVCVDALQVLPPRHWIAFMLGLVPSVCNWAVAQATSLAKSVWPEGAPLPDFSDPTVWTKDGTGALQGLCALGNGYLLSSMCLCSIALALVDRKFLAAAVWCLVSAVLSVVGLIHSSAMSWPWSHGLGSPPWQFACAYASCSMLFLCLAGLQALGRVPYGPVRGSPAETAERGFFASVIDDRLCEKGAPSASPLHARMTRTFPNRTF